MKGSGHLANSQQESPAFVVHFNVPEDVLIQWIEELDWRIQAYHRTFKNTEGSSEFVSETSQTSSGTNFD